MKNRMLAVVVAFFLSFSETNSLAQSSAGLRFVFGTWHPKGQKMAFLMPHKLDQNAYFVLNWGFIANYQRYVYKNRWSFKVAQGAYSDCARLFAGHTHLGLRLNMLNSRRHFLEIGFGPTLVYRQTWSRFPGYEQETGLLKNTDRWQWNFVWYGGEIEYDYRISPHIDLNINAIPGPPDFVTFAAGVRYWIRPRPEIHPLAR